MQHRLGLILLSLFFAFVPGLQAARWEPLPLWGGEVQVAAPEGGGSLVAYAVTRWGGGIYRTADGGVSWRFSGYGPNRLTVRIQGVDPQDPRRLYASYDGDRVSTFVLFRSDDGGRHWRQIGQNLPYVSELAFHPRNPSWLYAATDAGLYLSRNRGASWSLLALPDLGLEAVAVAPRAPEALLVTTWDGVSLKTQRSVDGGRTFMEVPDEGPRHYVFDPTRPRRVYGFTLGYAFYRSDDLGATWTRFFPASLQSLAVTRAGVLVAGTFDLGVQRSLDGGATWLPMPDELAARRPVDSITSLAVLEDRILAGGQRGIWRGSAEGRDWQAASDGVLAQSIGPLEVAADADSTLWVGVWRGFFLSPNDGGTFKSHGAALGPQTFLDRLAVHPREPQIAYARGCCVEGDGGVLRTDDGGRHWRVLPYNGVTRDFWVLQVDPEDPDVVYAGGFWGPHGSPCTALRSSDGGATWTCMTPPGVLDFIDLAFDPEDSRILYGLFGEGRLYRSADRGVTWTRLSRPSAPPILDIEADPSQPGRLYGYAGAYNGPFRSDDGGRTWKRKTLGLPQWNDVRDLLVDPARPGRVYAALEVFPPGAPRTTNHVFRSDDAGDHWVEISDGLPEARITGLAADPRSADVLYAGTFGHGLYRLRVEE